jgi:hypothetical protein
VSANLPYRGSSQLTGKVLSVHWYDKSRRKLGMIAKRFVGLTAIAFFATSPVLSAELPKVVDGAWFDGSGAEVFLPEKAFRSDAIASGHKSLQDLTDLFNEACLQVPVGTEFARSAIESRRDWGFIFIDANAGTAPGARLDGWQSAEMTVTSQGTTWPLAECNVYAARNSLDPI